MPNGLKNSGAVGTTARTVAVKSALNDSTCSRKLGAESLTEQILQAEQLVVLSGLVLGQRKVAGPGVDR